jgi:hypothetical protein
VGLVVIPVRPGRETLTHYFSFSCGTSTDSIESVPGHVTRNLCSASDGICGSRSALRCVRARETSTRYFSRSVGTGMDSTKSVPGHITPNLCFCIR